MAGAGQIGSIDAACDFVKNWCGVRTEHPWRAPPERSSFPDPLHRLGHRLGALWETRDHPYWTLHDQSHTVQLFEVQEHIFDPRGGRTLDGIACVIAENQGLYTLGYPMDGTPRLHVRGDWLDGGPTDRWRPVPGTTLEQALILYLLGNLFWLTYPTVGSAEERALERKPRDPGLTVPLIALPEWGFDGLFTNPAGTAFHHGGLQLTISKPAPLSRA